ncbi:sensor histidine kinase [Leptothoe sp. PORK10 BA2]|uniref:sensor histidine kinase n=1 Tax=Leptothoe sp. PORK10 BA2 TaxID=3110254 RepID=UPI002B21E509|nr:sensor histidine kinase [Leptothoe sp. PORK10 BA2]MEA5462402.1 sensor histidine kinase [Leptothoe sp. PORK10 BA2]
MSRAIQFHNHPFRFLLYLEWGLLAVAITSIVTTPPLREAARRGLTHGQTFAQWPLFTVGCLLLFGLLGLYLPTKGFWQQLGHIALQVVLILVASGLMLRGTRLFPFIYLVLVIRSCLMVGLMSQVTVTALAFLLFMTTLGLKFRRLAGENGPPIPRPMRHLIGSLQMNLIVFFGLALVFTLLLVNALLNERTIQNRLKKANEDLQRSATQVKQLATVEERSRIAREIHDSLGHSLTALNIQLEGAIKLSQRDPKKSQELLTEAKRLGSVALQDVRQSVATLRNKSTDQNSLQSRLNSLVNMLKTSTGITPNINIQLLQPLPEAMSMALYRLVQEGITNIVKHAEATAVDLSLMVDEQGIRLLLRDDGHGFDLGQTSTGFGLQGMRERAQAMGGNLTVNSRPGEGCEIRLVVPATG